MPSPMFSARYALIFVMLCSVGAALAQPRAVTPRGPLAADETANIAVFKNVSPSVVNITTLENQRNLFSLDVFQVPKGTGSGFVWDERGLIVTNFHVIQGASVARVTLSDQSEWNAKLVGAFADRDLAVLRIDAPREKLRAIAIGSSRDLVVGQRVYAIGNPFGLDQTLTVGIISALNREIQSINQRTIRGVIQTDAAINPGNSGGALVDIQGNLLGINTAIYSRSGGSMGIGFAIPIATAKQVLESLVKDGKVTRGWIGVEPNDLSAELAEAFDTATSSGVIITGVLQNGPAAQAGLRPGDIILTIETSPIQNVTQMLSKVAGLAPGKSVTFTVQRKQQKLALNITPGTRPKPRAVAP